MSFYLFLLFLALTVVVVLSYAIPIVVYRRERKDELTHSQIGLIGRGLYNNPSVCHVLLLAVFSSACIHFGIRLVSDYPYAVEILAFLSLTGLLALIVYYAATVQGRARFRTNRIVRDFQHYGHQRWVVQKYLNRLVQDSEAQEGFRSEVAARTLERLLERDDMTGDVVRELMGDPANISDPYPHRDIPNPIWEFRVPMALMLMGVIAIFASFAALNLGWLDVGMDALMVGFLLSFCGLCCLCYKASSDRKPPRYLSDDS